MRSLTIYVVFAFFHVMLPKAYGQNQKAELGEAALYYSKAKEMLDNRQFDKFDSIIIYANKSSKIYRSFSRWDDYLDNLNIKIQVAIRQYNKEQITVLRDSFESIVGKYKVNTLKHSANMDYCIGLQNFLDSKFDESWLFFSKSLDKRLALFGENRLEVVACYINIGLLYEQKSNFEKALEYYNKSKAIAEKILNKESLLVAQIIQHLGCLYKAMMKYDKAMDLMTQSLNIKRRLIPEMNYEMAQTYNAIGLIYFDQSDFVNSLHYFNKAINILTTIMDTDNVDMAIVYANIGAVYKRQSLYPEALNFQNKALEIRKRILGQSHIAVALSYNDIALIYDHLSDVDKALDYLNKSVEIKKTVLGERDLDVANSYNNIGTIYNNKGDYDLALEYHNKSLNIRKEKLGEKHHSIAECYNNIGAVYLNKQDYPKALEYFMKDLNLNIELLGQKHEFVALGYLNVAVAYSELDEFDKALECLKNSMEICRVIFGESSESIGKIHNNIATIYFKQGDFEKALTHFNLAIDIKRKILGPKSRDLTLSYFNLSYLCFEKTEYLTALSYAQRAITSNVIGFNDTLNITSNPKIESYVDYYTLLYSFLIKATICEYYADSLDNSTVNIDGRGLGKKDLYQLALHCYFQCDTIINQTRMKIYKQTDKITLGELANEIYNEALRLTFKLVRLNDSESETYKQDLFYFAEQNKGLVLLESIAGAEQLNFAGIPDSVMAAIRNLQDQITSYELKQAKEGDSIALAQVRDKLFELNRLYDSQLLLLEKNYPNYYNLKYSYKHPTVAEIQSKLDGTTAMRSYFMGNSNLYIFSLTKSRYDVWEIPGIEAIEDSISFYRDALMGVNALSDFTNCGEFLYRMLFPDNDRITNGITKLVIVPDGSLAFVPFESLPTKLVAEQRGGGAVSADSLRGFKTVGRASLGSDFSRYPFLIKRFNVSYMYSATLYYQSCTRSKDYERSGWLGLAPVFDETKQAATPQALSLNESLTLKAGLRGILYNGESIVPLPGTEDEVSLIHKEFLRKKINSKILLRADASEQNIKSGLLRNYGILHFATHGFVNSENPELSGILLSQDTSDGNDGILYSGEIYNLRLNADLTILSACETGLGRVRKGEGIIGLTRALLYAGSKNIMVSLWPVSDQSTSNLMVDFYKKMLDGRSTQSYSIWLREAKLKMIKETMYSNPFFWSPFILIGI